MKGLHAGAMLAMAAMAEVVAAPPRQLTIRDLNSTDPMEGDLFPPIPHYESVFAIMDEERRLLAAYRERKAAEAKLAAEAKISAAQSKRARRAAKRQRDAERLIAGQRRV